ncbi:MAG: 2-hydroxymuconic semialdehyde dehydrogenase, partial [Alphaproteobacteria bacterium]
MASKQRHEVRHFINGAFVAGTSGKVFDNINPVDGSRISIVHEANRADVDAAVSAARTALSGPWSRMTLADRVDLLYRVADGITARFDDFLDAECLDTGKPKRLARQIDIPRGAANFKIFADMIKNVPEETFRMDTPDGAGALNYAVRAPKGAIAVVCPWNLPLLLMTWKVGPALACGNTVVVKPSEETPSTAALLGEVMNEAGIPEGVYNVVHGFGPDSAGAFLTQHPGIDAVTFTGETQTGSAIMQAAAVGVRNVSLELGGKNPAIVFADCDLDKAVEGTMRSVFANSGQVCLGTERVFVERPLFDAFLERLAEGARNLKLGPPDDPDSSMGPVISRAHQRKVLSYYDRARRDGAQIVVGGGRGQVPKAFRDGAWVQPTIWTGLADDSVINTEEIFGPCCHVSPFDGEDEVVARANGTPYGL